MASSALIFTKLISFKYSFVDISSSESYPHLTKNEEDMSQISFMPLSMVCTQTIVKTLTNA
jgi:hypothetical protein